MCLILIAHQVHERLPLLVLANRDEFYDRPTTAAAPWDECVEVIGGRDLVSGGSWFAARGIRWASVTNVRDGVRHSHCHRSRGWLVRDYLLGEAPVEEFLADYADQFDKYAGFNLLLGDGDQLWHYSNRGPRAKKLPPGLYGLSNHLLDTPWPKVVRGKVALAELVSKPDLDVAQAFAILNDKSLAADRDLPATGIPLDWERALSAAFISFRNYGTRCSTLLWRAATGNHGFVERTYGEPLDSWQEMRYDW